MENTVLKTELADAEMQDLELEKNIKKLGRYCITRAVMEKAGTTFTKIGEMSSALGDERRIPFD